MDKSRLHSPNVQSIRLLAFSLVLFLFALSGTSWAGWSVYDNFQNGVIDPSKWGVTTAGEGATKGSVTVIDYEGAKAVSIALVQATQGNIILTSTSSTENLSGVKAFGTTMFLVNSLTDKAEVALKLDQYMSNSDKNLQNSAGFKAADQGTAIWQGATYTPFMNDFNQIFSVSHTNYLQQFIGKKWGLVTQTVGNEMMMLFLPPNATRWGSFSRTITLSSTSAPVISFHAGVYENSPNGSSAQLIIGPVYILR